MLIEFYGENFGCFRDPFCLSMMAQPNLDPGSERGIVEVPVEGEDKPLCLLRCAAIYGPNASGKSTVLDAAWSLGHLISASGLFEPKAEILHYSPFAGQSQRSPVALGVKAIIDGKVYEYAIKYGAREFIEEDLIDLSTDEVLIRRREQEVGGTWAELPNIRTILTDFRCNALVLSLAELFAPKLAARIAGVLKAILSESHHPGGRAGEQSVSMVATRTRNDPAFGSWLGQQLQAADTGIESFTVFPKETVAELMQKAGYERKGKGHKAADFFVFGHANGAGGFKLAQTEESDGTKKLIFFSPLMYSLETSADPLVVFVDEIEESLHPDLLEAIIRHFNWLLPAEKVRGQLIFATHETRLLDHEARYAPLRRDQIYLTSKGNDGAAELYSVGDFGPRPNHNIRKRYLQGRYGAVPSIGPWGDD